MTHLLQKSTVPFQHFCKKTNSVVSWSGQETTNSTLGMCSTGHLF